MRPCLLTLTVFLHPRLFPPPCYRLAAEQTKRSLSQSLTAPISVESLHEGEDLRSTINRPMFDTIAAPLTARILAAVNDALDKAAVTKDDVDQVILAGGMAANAKVQALIGALFVGKELKVDTFPDETAAVGAAIEGRKGRDVGSGGDLGQSDLCALSALDPSHPAPGALFSSLCAFIQPAC